MHTLQLGSAAFGCFLCNELLLGAKLQLIVLAQLRQLVKLLPEPLDCCAKVGQFNDQLLALLLLLLCHLRSVDTLLFQML